MSMAHADIITLRSKEELLDYLRAQNVTVPSRTQGRRRKEQCERRGAFRLLATLATADRFEYPASVPTHREKPDFLLRFAHREIGLEFTEAASREDAEMDALAHHMNTEVVLFADLFTRKDDEDAEGTEETPRRTAAQRQQTIQQPPPGGPGWGDDRGVPEWVEWIMKFIEKKTGNFAKLEFDKYSENWLLVYDNLPRPFARDTPKRWTELGVKLHEYFAQVCHYSTIFVDSANNLAEFTSVGCTVQPVANLWPT